uniref:Ig-like domain-containing protein n=1 Tax=Chelonoidis abingdonii TaxID=106734 RepID=A0A8C0HE20_CHEAB
DGRVLCESELLGRALATGGLPVQLPMTSEAVLGSTALLSCTYPPEADLILYWTRLGPASERNVYTYYRGEHLASHDDPAYRGRATVPAGQPSRGDGALWLHNVTLADEGRYRCRVKSNRGMGFAETELRLIGKRDTGPGPSTGGEWPLSRVPALIWPHVGGLAGSQEWDMEHKAFPLWGGPGSSPALGLGKFSAVQPRSLEWEQLTQTPSFSRGSFSQVSIVYPGSSPSHAPPPSLAGTMGPGHWLPRTPTGCIVPPTRPTCPAPPPPATPASSTPPSSSRTALGRLSVKVRPQDSTGGQDRVEAASPARPDPATDLAMVLSPQSRSQHGRAGPALALALALAWQCWGAEHSG